MTAAPSLAAPSIEELVAGRYLGPATVTRSQDATLEVALPSGGLVRPRLALAYAFVPAVGDTLLLIGQEERYFVIGVIASSGRSELRFRGDVELRAEGGTLDLSGERGVTVEGPSILLKTKKLSVLAEHVTEVFGSVFTRVKGLLSVRAGDADSVVDGEWSCRAESTTITSQEVASVNGKEVHLG